MALIEPYWEQQPEESDDAYGAFLYYLNLPPTERTFVSVSRGLGLPHRDVMEWKGRFLWRQRIISYVNDANQQRREALVEEQVRAIRNQIRIATGFQDKVLARLKTLEPNEIKPENLPTFVEVSVKIQNNALNLAAVHATEVDEKELARSSENVTKIMSNPKMLELIDKMGAHLVSERPVVTDD